MRVQVVLLACAGLAGCDDPGANDLCLGDIRVSISGIIQSVDVDQSGWYIIPIGYPKGGHCEISFLKGLGGLPPACSQGRKFTATGVVGDGPLFVGNALKVESIDCG